MIRSIRLGFAVLLALVALNATAGRSLASFVLVLHDVNTNTTQTITTSNANDLINFSGQVGNFAVSVTSNGDTTLFGSPSDRAINNFTISTANTSAVSDTLTLQLSESGLTALPNASTGTLLSSITGLNFKAVTIAGVKGDATGNNATVQSFVNLNPVGPAVLGTHVFSNPLLTLDSSKVGLLPIYSSAIGSNPVNFQLEQFGSLTLNSHTQGTFTAQTDFITPEPATMTLWGIGLAVCGFSARRRRNAKTA